jgi:hypothetical protein
MRHTEQGKNIESFKRDAPRQTHQNNSRFLKGNFKSKEGMK